ncbi:hypothetical protein O1L60_33830 [Streptomyces diastatochromogenes]|nr:hypothetical protein [Streptomyces diastatochromogenes]
MARRPRDDPRRIARPHRRRRGPDPAHPDGGLLLRLGPAAQCAVVRCEQEAIGLFVRETFALVPRGAEESHIDWGPLLASLGH